jgi:hypothetical protein
MIFIQQIHLTFTQHTHMGTHSHRMEPIWVGPITLVPPHMSVLCKFCVKIITYLLNPNRLGYRLFVFIGDLFIVLFIFDLFNFYSNWSRSKFFRIFILPIILSIILSRGFHQLHSQMTFTYLILFPCIEVLVGLSRMNFSIVKFVLV